MNEKRLYEHGYSVHAIPHLEAGCFIIIKNTMILTYLRSKIKGIVLMAYRNVYLLMHGVSDSY